MDLTDPIATALHVARTLRAADVPYGLYGGLAVAAYGVPRETRDADVAVTAPDARATAALLGEAGLIAVPAFERMRFGGLTVSRVSLLGDGQHQGLNTVDLVTPISGWYAELAMERTLRAPLRGEEIAILSPEDVVLFKLLSTRARDLDDAAEILRELEGQVERHWIDVQVDRLQRDSAEHDLHGRWQTVIEEASRPR